MRLPQSANSGMILYAPPLRVMSQTGDYAGQMGSGTRRRFPNCHLSSDSLLNAGLCVINHTVDFSNGGGLKEVSSSLSSLE